MGYDSDLKLDCKEICYNFHIQPWNMFKVAAHPLPRSSLYVKYKPDRAKWTVNMFWFFIQDICPR